jgi:nitric oxide reductase subunit C
MKPQYIFAFMAVAFLAFSFGIYTRPLYDLKFTRAGVVADKGKLVFQKYNCQSCHQVYGLGGYLGPDLTNVFDQPGKNREYVRAVITAGNNIMPPFMGNDDEKEALVQYLLELNETGHSDPRMLQSTGWGMTKIIWKQ